MHEHTRLKHTLASSCGIRKTSSHFSMQQYREGNSTGGADERAFNERSSNLQRHAFNLRGSVETANLQARTDKPWS